MAGAEPTEQGGAQTEPDKRPGWRQLVSAHWREIVSTVAELAGIGALTAGAWLIRPWCGLIVLGVGPIVIGITSSPQFARRGPTR